MQSVIKPRDVRGGGQVRRHRRARRLAHPTVAPGTPDRCDALVVFNALRSDELLVGVGRALRLAADARGPLEDYERSQLLSAFSVTRLLAAEQRAAADLLASTRAELLAALDGDDRPEAVDARRRLDAAANGIEIGEILVDVLAALPRDDETRTRLHAALRRMTDREVTALAGAAD